MYSPSEQPGRRAPPRRPSSRRSRDASRSGSVDRMDRREGRRPRVRSRIPSWGPLRGAAEPPGARSAISSASRPSTRAGSGTASTRSRKSRFGERGGGEDGARSVGSSVGGSRERGCVFDDEARLDASRRRSRDGRGSARGRLAFVVQPRITVIARAPSRARSIASCPDRDRGRSPSRASGRTRSSPPVPRGCRRRSGCLRASGWPHAEAAVPRRAENPRPAPPHRFGTSIAAPSKVHVRLVRRSRRLAGGDANLLLDQIDPRDHLRHGVLDLESRVHLEEVEIALRCEDELDRARRSGSRRRGQSRPLGSQMRRAQVVGRAPVPGFPRRASGNAAESEQSRSPRWSTWPWASARIWTSTCRGDST